MAEAFAEPAIDVGPAIDKALDAWARNVQPRVKQVVRKISAPRELVEDTQAWVKEKAPVARRGVARVRACSLAREGANLSLGSAAALNSGAPPRAVHAGGPSIRCRTT
jgi:hypothetical protein